MTTTIELCLTSVRSEQQSLIGALNEFVNEMNAGRVEIIPKFTWEHVADVDGGFRFALLRGGQSIAFGTVRSDFLRPGS